MIRFIAAACVVVAFALPAQAQETEVAQATITDADTVTAFAIKSGRLALTSTAHPGANYLPDGPYTNEGGTKIVFVDGSLVRVERTSGSITDIMTMRTNRQKMVILTPATNALMQVADMNLPSGTFRSEDGRTLISVMSGKPVAFVLAPTQ
jgi:hypothetical protein